MRKTKICVLVVAMMGSIVAIAATESTKTEKVVGFKPWYTNAIGQGAFSGKLEAGSTIAIDLQALDYQHKFAEYPGHEQDAERSEIHWLLDDKEVASKVLSFTLPADSAGKKLAVELIPYSKSGDPVRGKRLIISNFKAAGVEGGDQDGNIGIAALDQVNIISPNSSSIAKNGVEGHPVVNKDKMRAELINSAGVDISDQADNYSFEWKVDGVTAEKGIGKNTFTGRSNDIANDQGKTVSVVVLPKAPDYQDR